MVLSSSSGQSLQGRVCLEQEQPPPPPPPPKVYLALTNGALESTTRQGQSSGSDPAVNWPELVENSRQCSVFVTLVPIQCSKNLSARECSKSALVLIFSAGTIFTGLVRTGKVERSNQCTTGQLQIVSLTAGDSFKTLTSNETIETHSVTAQTNLKSDKITTTKKKRLRVGGPQSPFSISSSIILFFVLLPAFFLRTKINLQAAWVPLVPEIDREGLDTSIAPSWPDQITSAVQVSRGLRIPNVGSVF